MRLQLIVVAPVAFESWRLSYPETVRLRQTWEFETPDGALTISDIVELQQMGAVPYLPGGEIGQFKTIGNVPVSFELDGTRYSISSDPRGLIGGAIMEGRSIPPISMKGLRGTATTGFIRRLQRSGARIDVALPSSCGLPIKRTPGAELPAHECGYQHSNRHILASVL